MPRLSPHLAVTAVVVAVVGGCRLLPERYAVNAPLRNLLWGGGVEAASPDVLRERLRTRDGFTVSLWADDLPNARFLRVTPAGDLLVSQPRRGRVTLLERDGDGDGSADDRRDLAVHLVTAHP